MTSVAPPELGVAVRDGRTAYDEMIASVEKERHESFGALSQQLRQVGETNDALRKQTQTLVNALRAPGARGRRGEMQLKRVYEMVGMLENCNFGSYQGRNSSAPRCIRTRRFWSARPRRTSCWRHPPYSRATHRGAGVDSGDAREGGCRDRAMGTRLVRARR